MKRLRWSSRLTSLMLAKLAIGGMAVALLVVVASRFSRAADTPAIGLAYGEGVLTALVTGIVVGAAVGHLQVRQLRSASGAKSVLVALSADALLLVFALWNAARGTPAIARNVGWSIFPASQTGLLTVVVVAFTSAAWLVTALVWQRSHVAPSNKGIEQNANR